MLSLLEELEREDEERGQIAQSEQQGCFYCDSKQNTVTASSRSAGETG